jgi:TolB protein
VLEQKGIQMWPAWSPDGNRLVYANYHCGNDCGRFIQELWVADPSGGWARQLLMTNSFCQQPAWSPDGRKIAFSSDKSGNFDIWIVSLGNWKLEQTTNDESLDEHPAWSPDGNRLAFISRRSGLMEIWIQDLKTKRFRKLRPFGNRDVECKDVAW